MPMCLTEANQADDSVSVITWRTYHVSVFMSLPHIFSGAGVPTESVCTAPHPSFSVKSVNKVYAQGPHGNEWIWGSRLIH